MSDGTEEGTMLLKDIFPDQLTEPPLNNYAINRNKPHFLSLAGELLFFVAHGDSSKFSIWQTDGTLAGTKPLKDIIPGPRSSSPQYPLIVGKKLFFVAKDVDEVRKIWVSDGTSATTQVISEWPNSPSFEGPTHLFFKDERIHFLAKHYTKGETLFSFNPSDITLYATS